MDANVLPLREEAICSQLAVVLKNSKDNLAQGHFLWGRILCL